MKFGPVKRWLVSLALVAGLVNWLNPADVADQVQSLAMGWLGLALLISVAQTSLSAWRWRFTASRLGLTLTPARALAEYYLAGLINQVVPGGVFGDAWRAQRHARRSGETGVAWRAVILERASGQAIVAVLAMAAVITHSHWREAAGPQLIRVVSGLLIGGVLATLIWRWMRASAQWIDQFQADAYQALLKADAWPLQVSSSLLIVLSYLLVFAAGARGIGVELPLMQLLVMALPILLAMLIPVSVAGWGVREGAAGLVWLASGLPPEQGVAASITYGLLVLLGSLPGTLVLLVPDSTQAHIDQ